MLVYEVGYAVREGGVTLSSCCARWVVVGVGLRKVEVGCTRCAHDTTTSDVVLLNEILTSRSTNPN
jgi:hypothetical protein